MSQIESIYKAREIEEAIDIYFYRPLGYAVAVACRGLRITPNTVTILSIVIGVAGGHLLYYRDVAVNVWGFMLWVVADVLDSTDGQLARMTNQKSRLGRILDGLATNLIFLSMYGHLLARMVAGGSSPWLCVLVLASAFSHSVQSAIADYYRNAYLKFVVDPERSELEGPADVRAEYKAISYSEHPVRKFLLRIYLNYTVEQGIFTKTFQELHSRVNQRFGHVLPTWFVEEYSRLNKPLMKYYALLVTNTRVIIMAVCVLIDHVQWYFWAEILALNAVMLGVTLYQARLNKKLLHQIDIQAANE